jgi:hypothetical protein
MGGKSGVWTELCPEMVRLDNGNAVPLWGVNVEIAT